MFWHQWAVIDYVFALIILISTGFALKKGLAREAISLVSLVGGFLLAAFCYPVAARWFIEFSRTETLANLAGFLIIFFGCLLLGAVAAFVMNRFIKMASLEWMDHLLGAVFGILRGWAVASIIALALIAFPIRQENVMANSFFAPYLLAGARAAVLIVPQDLKDRFHEEYDRVLQNLNRDRTSA
jgi:membrane protein required for colicin V production